MTVISFAAAIRNALAVEMDANPALFIIGEDIGRYGGELGATAGLYKRFGEDRVRDAPISESAIIGAALGAAITGNPAVAEIPFGDFLGMCMDQICNQVAKIRYMSGGQVRVPVVIRTTIGGYMSAGAQHSQSLESWFVHLPGIKVVMPSNPSDAFGLLRSSIQDMNPVLFLEHKGLYSVKGDVPDNTDFLIPLGCANVVREGKDLTILATGAQVSRAVQAAEQLIDEGIEAEIIDPRSLDPLDLNTITSSIKKTGHLIIVHEAWERGGFGSEIAALVSDKAFGSLKGPIKRVAAKNVPSPFSPRLEQSTLPQTVDIFRAALETRSFKFEKQVNY